MKKIVVLGSTGMAGHMIFHYLKKVGFDVYGISRSENNTEHSARIDITDINQICYYIDKIHADVIINCIGLLQKACDNRPDLAIFVNSYFPHYLENYYRNAPSKIIQLSTDCVFSGDKGKYLASDLPDGRTFYDRSKSLGELNNEKDLTFRMSIIGPDIDPSGTGLFNWFMKQSGTIYGFSKVQWNGITTLELAKALVSALEQNLSGLYQLVPDQSINKYQLLLYMQSIFQKDNVEILENRTVISDKTLVNERTDFHYHLDNYNMQLIQMKEWIETNQHLYPKYYLKRGYSN